ncbi:MAG: glycosyltransferase family 39 protein [Parcubacteria group bacterium]
MIFQSDQSRDSFIVNKAIIEGIDKLPLSGPQARGSELHLGPIFYYFQYFSGKIFGASPESFAYPDLFFGILTIPVLFFLLRMFVSNWIALGVTGLASVSLFLVTFSRFAWNPNSLPFFSTLLALFFALSIGKNKSRVWILVGLSICTGIIFQLHFVVALSLLGSLLVFLLLFQPLNWKEFLICVFVIFIFQAPTFLYEIKNKGAMSEIFIKTVEEKGSQNNNHGIHEKFFRAYQEEAKIFWLVATGGQNTNTILTRGFSLKCDKDCRTDLPITVISLLFFSFLIWIGFWKWKKEKDITKQILLFFGIWFGSFFLITVLLAYQISTRFYLGITPLIFLLVAFLLEWLAQIIPNNFSKALVSLIILVFIFLNLYSTDIYLKNLSYAGKTSDKMEKDLVFGTEEKVTLGQLRAIATKIDNNFSDNGFIFISGESRYVRSLYYILSIEKGRKGCYQKGSLEESIFQNHVLLIKNKGENGAIPFGTMSVQLISPQIDEIRKDILPKECFVD